MENKREKQIEFLVNELGRHGNPKWDHPIFGYEAFNINHQMYLQDHAAAILDELLSIEDDETELPVIQNGDLVRYNQDCPGWWAEVGTVLEGPDGEDVYYLIPHFGEVPRGTRYRRSDLEKLPAQPYPKFNIGDKAYVDTRMMDVSGPREAYLKLNHNLTLDDYIQVTIIDVYLGTGLPEYSYRVTYDIVPSYAKHLPKYYYGHELGAI